MSDTVDKSKSPFDSESEEDTIALSKDELDNILSEAEIVQVTQETESDFEPLEENTEVPETVSEEKETEIDAETELLEEGDFDISGEIDELSPEDLENIELEESDIEQYSQELESELGDELELPEMKDEESESDEGFEGLGDESEKESPESDTTEKRLEASVEEEMDLDTYLDSVKSDVDMEGVDIEGIDLGEESLDDELVESLEESFEGEAQKEAMEIDQMGDSEDAFKEAGIEGIEEDVEMSDEELLKGLEEAGLTPKQEESNEFTIPEDEEPTLAFDEEAGEEPEEGAILEEEPFKSDVELSEEEERILSEDIDLKAEKLEPEEIVTVSGEDLDKMSEEESLPEPGALEKEVTAGQTGGDKMEIDQTLFNDITVILKYMDNLLGELPEEKIKEFAQSKYFSLYKEVFEKLNLT